MASYRPTKFYPWAPESSWPPRPDLTEEVDLAGNELKFDLGDRPTESLYDQAFRAWYLADAKVHPDEAGEPVPSRKAANVLVRNIMAFIRDFERGRMSSVHRAGNWLKQHSTSKDDNEKTKYARAWLGKNWRPPLLNPEDADRHTIPFRCSEGNARTFLPISDLPKWSIEGRGGYLIPDRGENGTYLPWELYTIAIVSSPYNPTYWVSRAFEFWRIGHYDLALGDAYRAMYLAEIIQDSFKRNKRTGLYNFVHDALEKHLWHAVKASRHPDEAGDIRRWLQNHHGVPYFVYCLRIAINHTISYSLIECGAWRDYWIHEHYLTDRLTLPEEQKELFTNRRDMMSPIVQRAFDEEPGHEPNNRQFRHEARPGFIRAKRYPQTPEDTDVWRSGEIFLDRLNREYLGGSPFHSNHFLGVKTKMTYDHEKEVAVNQLSVYATQNIEPETVLHIEEPNIRGIMRKADWKPRNMINRYVDSYHWQAGQTNKGKVPPLAVPLPRLEMDDYRCENCLRRPTQAEYLLHAVRVARLGNKSNVPGRTDQHLCSCMRRNPMTYFCWEEGGFDEDKGYEFNEEVEAASPPRYTWGYPPSPESSRRSSNEFEAAASENGDRIQQWHPEPDNRDSGQVRQQGQRATRIDVGIMDGGVLRPRRSHEPFDGGDPGPADRGPRQVRQWGNPSAAGRPSARNAPKQAAGGKRKAPTSAQVPRDQETSTLPNGRTARITTDGRRELRDGYVQCAHRRDGKQTKSACCQKGIPFSKKMTWADPDPDPEDGNGEEPDEESEVMGVVNEGSKRQTCLQVARKVFHHKACGKRWKWLHQAMQKQWRSHHTILSLLLREVFDMTLQSREKAGGKEGIFPHEIDPVIPLSGGEFDHKDDFPFGWAANIQVPFDILEELGVNIFRDLSFDTWTIQLVLRKLLMNAVPWDKTRRTRSLNGVTEPAVDLSFTTLDNAKTITEVGIRRPWSIEGRAHWFRHRAHTNIKNYPDKRIWDDEGRKMIEKEITAGDDLLEGRGGHPRNELRYLFVHTAFSLFNHGCQEEANAYWCWDKETSTPNRIIVKAAKNIPAGDEIRLLYFPDDMRPLRGHKAYRLFGRKCDCARCLRMDTPPPSGPPSSSGSQPPSSPHPSPCQESTRQPPLGDTQRGKGRGKELGKWRGTALGMGPDPTSGLVTDAPSDQAQRVVDLTTPIAPQSVASPVALGLPKPVEDPVTPIHGAFPSTSPSDPSPSSEHGSLADKPSRDVQPEPQAPARTDRASEGGDGEPVESAAIMSSSNDSETEVTQPKPLVKRVRWEKGWGA